MIYIDFDQGRGNQIDFDRDEIPFTFKPGVQPCPCMDNGDGTRNIPSRKNEEKQAGGRVWARDSCVKYFFVRYRYLTWLDKFFSNNI